MTVAFVKTALKRFNQRRDGYFGILLLEAQDSVLDAACSVRTEGDVPDAGAFGEVVAALLNVKND